MNRMQNYQIFQICCVQSQSQRCSLRHCSCVSRHYCFHTSTVPCQSAQEPCPRPPFQEDLARVNEHSTFVFTLGYESHPNGTSAPRSESPSVKESCCAWECNSVYSVFFFFLMYEFNMEDFMIKMTSHY